MSELYAVWVASLLGAGIFYAAGFLTSRHRAIALGDAPANQLDLLSMAAMRADEEARASAREIELAELRTSLGDAKAMAARVVSNSHSQLAALRSEVEALRVEAAVVPVPVASSRAVPAIKSLSKAKRTKRRGNPQDVLQSVVSEVAEAASSWAVVLADRTGLPVVVAGDHGQELAAYASIVAELACRTQSFVPVEGPDYADFVDNKGATISVWPFVADSENFSLTIYSGCRSSDEYRVQVRDAITEVVSCIEEDLARSVPLSSASTR